MLSPFPVVRIRGRILRQGVVVDILSIAAQRGAKVRVRCRGRGCPRARVVTRVTSDRRVLRIRAFERRRLAVGIVLEVRVTKGNRIGKYTRFVVRRGVPPARRDLCLIPGARAPRGCALR